MNPFRGRVVEVHSVVLESEVVTMQYDREKAGGSLNRNVVIIVGIVLLLVLVSGGGMMGMMFMWPLLLIAGVGLAIWLARGGRLDELLSQFGTQGDQSQDRALDILRERYARGEITQEQYEQMRHELE